jgi:hypothetical protein
MRTLIIGLRAVLVRSGCTMDTPDLQLLIAVLPTASDGGEAQRPKSLPQLSRSFT